MGKFVTNVSQELLHIGFYNLVQVLWIICCFMWKRTSLPTYSDLNFSIFLSLQFSDIKKKLSLFSGTERHTKLKLGPHMDSRLMYHVYLNQAAGVYLFLDFFNFLSLKFQNFKFFVTLFLWGLQSWNLIHTWVNGWSSVYTKFKQAEYTCSSFLSLQLAKIKNLLLQNCFSMPLMATAGGMWALLTLCYILSFSLSLQ